MEKESNEKQDSTKSKIEHSNTFKKRLLEETIINLSDDIKEYQTKLKILGPQNKTVESLSKKILSKLSENNYEIIQVVLNKKKRTNDDLNIIKTFLSTMKYLSSMIKVLDVDKILYSLSIYLKMEKKTKDSILFRFGSKGTKFYILLSGQVTILILKETFVNLSFMKYVMHLIMLKILGEDETVKKIIIANNHNQYHLDEKAFENLFERLSEMGNKKMEKKNKNNKVVEEKYEEEEEESEEESNEDNKEEKQEKIKDLKENDKDFDKTFKRTKTLQLNYLVSNYNGLLNSKDYKYVKTNFKNENMKTHDFLPLKRLSTKSNIRLSRRSVIQQSYYDPDFPFFHKEEEIQEFISYYIYLKEAIPNFKKKKFSVVDYIEDTYIYSTYSKELNRKYEKEKERYLIYKYHDIVQKFKGDTFGELALQHEDSKRTATIITNTDCIIGYLSKNAYETCLSEIELKRRKNEVNFIMSFAIFDQMNWISFENKYFNYFKREFYSHKDNLIKQGDKVDKIFFIMSGQFEITTSLSIGGLYKIIRQKRKEALDNYKIKVNKKKHKIRLSICNNKDIIGLNDCCYYKPNGEKVSFVNVTCISPKSIAFTLDKNILDGLKIKLNEINKNVINIINKREKALVDRLISIFNTLIKQREININEKLEAINTKNVSPKNKTKYFVGKKRPFNKYKKGKSGIMKEDTSLNFNKRLNSANYKEVIPVPKIKNIINPSMDEQKFNYSSRMKSALTSNNSIQSKINSEKVIFRGILGNKFTEKDSKSTFSLKDKYKKENIENLYHQLNQKMIKEFNDLNSNKEENKNENNTIQQEMSKKLFENDSLNIINNDKRYIKNQKFGLFNKLNMNKDINFFEQNNLNIFNDKYINKISTKTINEEDKINGETLFSQEKKIIKPKTISNESYLKQILGTRYREEDDEFISYAERKFMKTFKDYNNEIKNITKMKLKFKRKFKKK